MLRPGLLTGLWPDDNARCPKNLKRTVFKSKVAARKFRSFEQRRTSEEFTERLFNFRLNLKP